MNALNPVHFAIFLCITCSIDETLAAAPINQLMTSSSDSTTTNVPNKIQNNYTHKIRKTSTRMLTVNPSSTSSSTNILDDVTEAMNSSEDSSLAVKEVDKYQMNSFFNPSNHLKHNNSFLSCSQTMFLFNGKYVAYSNGSVFVPLLNKLLSAADYKKNQFGILVCKLTTDVHSSAKHNRTFLFSLGKDSKEISSENHLDWSWFKNSTILTSAYKQKGSSHKEFNPPYLAIVALSGNAICSIFFILYQLMTYIRYYCMSKRSNLLGYSMFNICRNFLVVYTCMLLTYVKKSDQPCPFLGSVRAYFYLASIAWVNVMTYDIRRSLRMAMQRLTASLTTMRLCKHIAYTWITPFCPIAICLLVYRNRYTSLYDNHTCWFGQQDLLVYFVIPLVLLTGISIGFLVSSYKMIRGGVLNTIENEDEFRSEYLMTLYLVLVMTITWIFDILATLTQEVVITYFTAICTVLQGLVIFFNHEAVLKCRKAVQNSRNTLSETTTSSTSVWPSV